MDCSTTTHTMTNALDLSCATIPMAGVANCSLTLPMAGGANTLAAGISMPKRPSKKEREAEKRSNFYLGIPEGENRPRFQVWGERMAHSYLTHFNTDYLHKFYEPGSVLSFINNLVPDGQVTNLQGSDNIYSHLQAFRSLKCIHLNSLVVQPKTDHHSILVTMNINIEPPEGDMCSVVTTLILEKLPGKKTRRVIGEADAHYEACQYIANQTFMIVG